MYIIRIPYLTVMFFLLLISCAGQDARYKNKPLHYDIHHPETFAMPAALLEVSGIAFLPGVDSTVYAEQDEEGKLFWLKPGHEDLQSLPFGPKGDYEDISIGNSNFFILRSDGAIFSFPLQEVHKKAIEHVKEWKKILPKSEYEGMYFLQHENALYILSKTDGESKKTAFTNVYKIPLDIRGNPGAITRTLAIPQHRIADLAGIPKIKFHPSALAYNQQEKRWYILSSVNKMLVIADTSMQPLQVYRLHPAQYLQPEGISFDSKGNLWLSSEGDKVTPGKLYRINRK